MDFLTGFLVLTNWKGDSYDGVFVILDRLTNVIDYTLIKTMIDATNLTEIIMDVVVWYQGFQELIVNNPDLLFTTKV